MDEEMYEEKKKAPEKNLGTVSIVLAIIGLVLGIIGSAGFLFALVGMILAIISLSKKQGKRAIIGLLVSVLALIISVGLMPSTVESSKTPPPIAKEEPIKEEPKQEEPLIFKQGEVVSIIDSSGEVLYNVTIDSVEKTEDRNQFDTSNPAEVIKIRYTYENIANPQELYISSMSFKVIDASKSIASTYPNGNDNYPERIPVGVVCSADESFGLKNASSTITIHFYGDIYSAKPIATWILDI